MLSDKTVRALNGASKATLKQGVRIKHLFRMMTHFPDLWMQAYANIHANKGALTAGVDGSTLDGMSEDRINRVIQLLKDGKYKPEPARRVYVLKKNGKLRPLGIPSADDKLVQEVVRMLLELIYEPIFSQYSHGFRPKRSCHTALLQVRNEWKGIKWIVDMDISGFYDNIDHEIMIRLLEKKIDDKNFIELIKLFLQAGYLEEWKFNATYTGTPQGGICSPILANIFLHELDQFMEKKAADYNKGKTRRLDPTYFNLTNRADLLKKKIKRAEDEGDCFDFFVNEMKEDRDRLRSEAQKIPSRMTHDEGFRRLRYVRYADDSAIDPSTLKDNEPTTVHFKSRTEILDRINAGKCEYCGTDQGPFEVHHIRKLADLAKKNTKQPWEVLMCARNRKTMVLCKECHRLLHSGQLQGWRRDFFKKAEMESAVHGNVHAALEGDARPHQ